MNSAAQGAALPEGVQRVSAALQAAGHAHPPRLLDAAARTAQQAADGLGVALGQIAKSIIFKRLPDERAVLVITAGDRRVDEAKVARQVCAEGQRLGRADAAFVKVSTGFSIGGVAPIAHAQPPVTLIDSTLRRFDSIWAAAGHPHAVFELTLADLERLTQAPVADVAQATGEPVPSPCKAVCTMADAVGGAESVCRGCWRTLSEITAWGQLDDQAKRDILRQLPDRARQGHA